MSGGLPDERRLRAVEQQVLDRIRRRARIRARLASGAVAAAIVVGGIVLVHPSLPSVSSGSGSAAGSSARSPSQADSSAEVRCHETSATGSPAKVAPLPAHVNAASVAAACAQVVPKGASGSAGTTSASGASTLVVCRRHDGGFEVFPKDGQPATLCTRNGLLPG